METSFKTGFTQISFAAQKIWVGQNLGGLQPPGPYAYVSICTNKLQYLNMHLLSYFNALSDGLAVPKTVI